MRSARRRPPARPRSTRTLLARLAAPALVATTVASAGLAAGVAVTQADGTAPTAQRLSTAVPAALGSVGLDSRRERALRVSRSATRTAPAVTIRPRPTGHRFATAPLNIWARPREQGERLGLVPWGTRLAVTGQRTGRWAQVLLGDRLRLVRWVNADYLARTRPVLDQGGSSADGAGSASSGSAIAGSDGASAGGLSTAPCPDGSAIESGLTPAADLVYRAACAAFPALSTYGGYAPRGEHADGRAIDIMTTGAAGWELANWLRANAARLQIRNVIYSQRIWTPERSAEGWRYMEDRGSATANHMDHVHVAVY